MRHVLVTGADGQLGKCLKKIAKDFSDLSFEFHNSKTFDITDPEKTASVFSKVHFDFCVNCAAYTNVEQAEKTPIPAFKINAEGVRMLAEACLKYQVTLIHISTDYVFDGTKEIGYLANDNTNPINEYGKSKLKGEAYIQEILQRYFIIRTSWLYSEFGNNFYKTVIKKAQAGEDLQITNEQTGCPTNANNLAAFLLDLIEKNSTRYGIHHFTDGVAMTWYDFAKKILKENGFDTKVKPQNFSTLARRPKWSVLK